LEAAKPGGLALACIGFAGGCRCHDGSPDRVDRRSVSTGLVGCMGDFGGGVAGGRICSGHEQANASCAIDFCIGGVFCVGVGQDHLCRGVAFGGADCDFGIELVCLGGRFCGDDEGLLAGHVAGLDEAKIEVEHLMNGLLIYVC